MNRIALWMNGYIKAIYCDQDGSQGCARNENNFRLDTMLLCKLTFLASVLKGMRCA